MLKGAGLFADLLNGDLSNGVGLQFSFNNPAIVVHIKQAQLLGQLTVLTLNGGNVQSIRRNDLIASLGVLYHNFDPAIVAHLIQLGRALQAKDLGVALGHLLLGGLLILLLRELLLRILRGLLYRHLGLRLRLIRLLRHNFAKGS